MMLRTLRAVPATLGDAAGSAAGPQALRLRAARSAGYDRMAANVHRDTSGRPLSHDGRGLWAMQYYCALC